MPRWIFSVSYLIPLLSPARMVVRITCHANAIKVAREKQDFIDIIDILLLIAKGSFYITISIIQILIIEMKRKRYDR